MYKMVKLGEMDVPMLANAATPYRFKQIYGMDLMKELTASEGDDGSGSLFVVEKLAYLMAMSAKGADMNAINEDTFYAWLEGFETTNFVDSAREITNLYLGQGKSTSKPKNGTSRQSAK